MLKKTPNNLYEECRAAEEFTKKHVSAMDSMIVDMIAGSGYRSDLCNTKNPTYENVSYEFITQMVPTLAFNCPRVTMGDHYPTFAEEQVQHETAALNQFGLDNRMGVFLRRIAVDRCFGFSVVKVSLGESPKPKGFMWPMVSRVRPSDFLIDPECTHEDDARWFGEIIEEDRDDLLDDPKFNTQAVLALPSDEAPKDGEDKKSGPPRNRVRFYELYCVEDGLIYTIGTTPAGGGEGVWLREPRKPQCGKRGPFVIFGHLPVPNRPLPLSELAAAKQQSDELNLHATQIAGDAGTAKRLMAYDKSDPGAAEGIIKGENGSTLGVMGDPNKIFMPIEWGGPQAANLDYSQILKDRLNRLLGITDTQRGEVDPNATATAENYAAQGSSKREQFSKAVFQEQVGMIYSRALTLMRRSMEVAREMLIPAEDGEERAVGTFVGGGRQEGLGAEDESDVKIEPYSMEYTSEGLMQRRAMQTTELIGKIAPVARQFPEWDWSKIVDDQLSSLNVQGGGARYLDSEMLAQFQGMTMGMMPGQELMPGAGQQPGAPMGPGDGEEGGIPQEYASMLGAAAGVG